MATVGTMVELNSFELNEDGSMDVVRSTRGPWIPSHKIQRSETLERFSPTNVLSIRQGQ